MIDSYLTWQEHTVKCTIEISTQNTAQSLGQLGQWLGVRLQTKWFGVWVQLQSLKLQILSQFRARSSLTFRLLQSVDSLWNVYVTWGEHTVKCTVPISTQNIIYELSSSRFESSCSHLNFRFCACFKQGVPWHSGNYRVWIQSETRTWHEKNIQSLSVIFMFPRFMNQNLSKKHSVMFTTLSHLLTKRKRRG